MKIDITDETYKRLGSLVEGFESPDSVINRLLNHYEGAKQSKPKVVFSPPNEEDFKRLLLRNKEAEVVIYRGDGSREITQWDARRFKAESNLRANLWSGYLRDWKKKGIVRIELSIYPARTRVEDRIEYEQDRALSLELGLTFSELRELGGDYEISTNESEDGLVYGGSIRFFDSCNADILAKVNGLSGDTAPLSPNFFA